MAVLGITLFSALPPDHPDILDGAPLQAISMARYVSGQADLYQGEVLMQEADYLARQAEWEPIVVAWRLRLQKVRHPEWAEFYAKFENSNAEKLLSVAADQTSKLADLNRVSQELGNCTPIQTLDGNTTVLINVDRLIRSWTRIATRPGVLPVLSASDISTLNDWAKLHEIPMHFAANGAAQPHDRLADLRATYQS